MNAPSESLVDLVRHFLEAYGELRRLAVAYRERALDWPEVDRLIDDSDRSVLFRLKERCHELFRDDVAVALSMRREAMLDLAVGSLFHEAMKFRENFYQRKVYGPKIRALRREPGAESDSLFREFEKILAASSVRIDEALLETETLLAQTRDQLRLVLADFRGDGLLARYLVDHADRVASVFGQELDEVFAEIHGAAADGFALAARSRLESGHFRRAAQDLAAALERAPDRVELRDLCHYAEGMEAFRRGRYDDAVQRLGVWIEGGLDATDAQRVGWALGALSRLAPLLDDEERARLGRRAEALAESLQGWLASGSAAAPGQTERLGTAAGR